ncbi:MAG: hypothetical protein ABSG79_20595 [Bryobacteraceae bacterium]
MRRAWVPAMVCTLLGLSWQLLTVHYNYGGNLTALFCTGSKVPTPPSLAREHIYVFPNSGGYDGQSYHYVAHDPLRRSDIGRAVPDPLFRYPRILLPGMAYLMALGRQPWIDVSYVACNLAFLFLGSWWLALLLIRLRIHPWFAVFYVLVPASLISLDRLVVDLACTSLCLGFAVYASSGPKWKLYALLVAAALCRESGFLLTAAYALHLLALRRFRLSLLFTTAILPAVAWNAYVVLRIPGSPAFKLLYPIPLWGLMRSLWLPTSYPFGPVTNAAIRAFDGVELAGLTLAMALAFRNLRKVLFDPVRTACLLWAIFGMTFSEFFWTDCYAAARILSPLLLFLFLRSLSSDGKLGRLPLAMVVPRVWLEITPQVLGVLRGLW